MSLIDMAPAPVVVLLDAAPAAAGEPVYLGLSKDDEFLLCAKRLCGKPVLADWFGREQFPSPCPATRGQLDDYLAQKGYRVLDAGDWVYLIDERRYVQVPGRAEIKPIQWKRLQIVPKIEQWEIPGSKKLSPDEKAKLGKQILETMRPVPLPVDSSVEQDIPGERITSPDGETAMKQMFLWLGVRRLSRDGPDAVVSVLTGWGHGGVSRLAYGEMVGGQYRTLWDSPLFDGYHVRVGSRDVNGDGVEEILLWSQFGTDPRYAMSLLSILDRNGTELTRQEKNCGHGDEVTQWRSEVLDLVWEQQAVLCPIIADEMQLVGSRDGKTTDIIAKGVDWYKANDADRRPYRYHLEKGRYVDRPVPQPRKHPTKRGAQ